MSEAKEYLKGVKMLDAQINARLSEKEEIEDKLKHITPTLSLDKGTGSAGTQDKMGGMVAKLVDLDRAIDADIDRFVDLKNEALALLDKMNNPTYMTILHRRYFLHHTFERIASDMGYSWRWVCKLHGRALQEYEKNMPGKQKRT